MPIHLPIQISGTSKGGGGGRLAMSTRAWSILQRFSSTKHILLFHCYPCSFRDQSFFAADVPSTLNSEIQSSTKGGVYHFSILCDRPSYSSLLAHCIYIRCLPHSLLNLSKPRYSCLACHKWGIQLSFTYRIYSLGPANSRAATSLIPLPTPIISEIHSAPMADVFAGLRDPSPDNPSWSCYLRTAVSTRTSYDPAPRRSKPSSSSSWL